MTPHRVGVAVFLLVCVSMFGRWGAAAALLVVLPALWLGRRDPRPRPGRRRRVWTDAERRFILDRDGWQCVQCGSTDELEIDHVIPFSRGGACSIQNSMVLCRSCNARKGAN